MCAKYTLLSLCHTTCFLNKEEERHISIAWCVLPKGFAFMQCVGIWRYVDGSSSPGEMAKMHAFGSVFLRSMAAQAVAMFNAALDERYTMSYANAHAHRQGVSNAPWDTAKARGGRVVAVSAV